MFNNEGLHSLSGRRMVIILSSYLKTKFQDFKLTCFVFLKVSLSVVLGSEASPGPWQRCKFSGQPKSYWLRSSLYDSQKFLFEQGLQVILILAKVWFILYFLSIYICSRWFRWRLQDTHWWFKFISLFKCTFLFHKSHNLEIKT